MNTYKSRRLKNGLSDKICIDTCIVNEIKYLWDCGIKTYGCCCGHGKDVSWVNVKPEDFNKIELLGYKKFINNVNDFTYELKFKKEEL